ncbi:MAG: hypothetical protein Q9197_004949 [Variospora fuerteventurae]
MVQLIEEQLDALKQVSEEQEDGRSSTAESASSLPESTISTSPTTYTGQVDDEDDAPDYRRSLCKHRLQSAAVLIRRKKGPPRSIDTIGDAKSGCKFPDQKRAIQPIWLENGGLIKLHNQPNGQNGANKRVYDATSKWYVVVRAVIKLEPDSGSQLKAVQNFVLLFRMIKDTGFHEIFDITNNQVYSAFAAIEQAIQDLKILRSNRNSLPHDWAAEYLKWLEAYLNRISGPVWTWTWDK